MNRVAQIIALMFLGLAYMAERERKAPPAISMNLVPVGDTVEARFLGGPLHGQNLTIPNKKYHRVALAPQYASMCAESVPAINHVYVRTGKSKASGAWLYIYWGRA